MKWPSRILLCIVAAIILCMLAKLVFVMAPCRPSSPASFVASLSLDPATYANVDSISKGDLVMRTYAYERNQYVDAFPGAKSLPKLADGKGHVPVFRFGDDIFVLTYKWVNSSDGLAISSDKDFKSRIEAIDHSFLIRPIRDNIYQWELNL